MPNNIQLVNDDCHIVSINLDELIHGRNKVDCSPAESSLEDSEESPDSKHYISVKVKQENNQGFNNKKKMNKIQQANAVPAIEKKKLKLRKKISNRRITMTKDQTIPLRN